MKIDLRKVLRVTIVLMTLPMGGEALATCIEDCDPAPELIPGTLPNCNDVTLAGIMFDCPLGDKPRVIQVFNLNTVKGTSSRLACVCNAVFNRCNPNLPAGTKVAEGEFPACAPGTLQVPPSGVELDGSSTTYCETIGGKRICYNRK